MEREAFHRRSASLFTDGARAFQASVDSRRSAGLQASVLRFRVMAMLLAVLAAGLTFITPDGWRFIKLTGPEKTVATWERAFDQFVGSFKLQ